MAMAVVSFTMVKVTSFTDVAVRGLTVGMAGFTEAIMTLAMTKSSEASMTFAAVVNVEVFMSISRERFRRMTVVKVRGRTVARDMATMSFTTVET